MPSLLQLFGVKKGTESSPSRRGLSPFSRKVSSAPRGRHLRTRSDNTSVVCHSLGARSADFSKGYSTVGHNGRDSEPYESKYERYRQIYLTTTSPERELATLNAAVVNVRKWLKKKHECLKLLQDPQSPGHRPGSAEGTSKSDTASPPALDNKLNYSPEDREALLKKLVAESGHQQEAVDVLLDRGRRYLYQRANITLEVDLENLAFLWNAYTRQLHLLHDPNNSEPPTPELSFSVPLRGKENLQSTPIRWKKTGRSFFEKRDLFHEFTGSEAGSISSEKGAGDDLPEFSTNTRCKLPFGTGEAFASSDPNLNTPSTSFVIPTEDHSLNKASVPSTTETPFTIYEDPCEEKDAHKNLPEVTGIKHSTEKGSAPRASQPTKPSPSQVNTDREREALKADQRKRTPRLTGRGRVLAVSTWPGASSKGWLHVPGEGIFTEKRNQRSLPALNAFSPQSDRPSSLTENSRSQKTEDLAGGNHSPSPTANGASLADDQCTTPGRRSPTGVKHTDGLLGKRGKEIHNEQQQKQQQLQLQRREEGDGSSRETDVASSLSPDFSDLKAMEEKLTMELEKAAREISGMNVCPMDTSENLDLSLLDVSSSTSSSEAKAANASLNSELLIDDSSTDTPDDADLPTEPKRRRMNLDTPSSLSSCSGSPLISGDNSLNATPSSSPAGTLRRDFKKHYKKDELWKAIESNYQYLMDKEIIETCQSTESDLSHDEDFVPNVSFAEFLKQYQELIDWLNQAQRNTQRTVTSLSEKYLNQSYHEEMLEKSPRREFLHKYVQQLLLHYPNLRDQVQARMQRLNTQWTVVEAAISSSHGIKDMNSMLQDLECDLTALRRWLNATESRLMPMTIRADWTDGELEERLKEHQLLQQDIESHSRIVSAVLKLSKRLDEVGEACPTTRDFGDLPLVALNLERRWHGIWLQSLEWQCRLEEAINRRKGLYGSTFNFSSFTLPTLDESGGASDLELKGDGSILSSSNGSLIELSDESLLFIGARTEHRVDNTPSPVSPTGVNVPALKSSKLISFLDRSSGDSANISECESRVGDSPLGVSPKGRVDLSLSMSSDGEVDPAVLKAQQEPKDIGYSSESQSNDETELQQIALECRFAGICEVASDSPLGEKVAIPQTAGVRQDYYCMTHVELDSTDKTTDDGNTTDDKMSEQAQDGKQVVGGVDNMNTFSTPSTSSLPTKCGSHEDITVKSWLESSDEAETLALTTRDAASGSFSESDSAPESKIRYLIEHVEDLVKPSPRAPAPGSPEKRVSPSKQTQTVCTETTSSVESSCDASSENSEESGAEEFSTATDDADETLFDSVINLDSTVNNSREDCRSFINSPVALDSARLRKQTGPRSKKDRPWSVVGLQDLKKIDFQPLSTSESAIDRIHPQTDTDSSSASQFLSPTHASTFPRRRNRGIQRAFSSCEQTSPRAAKRKLKYSSSSSATDSQTSKSSATKVAASTEEEEDSLISRTLVYSPVDQMRAQAAAVSSLTESETETTDEYETAPMDDVMTSADEDPHNSTGSFSENAWDPYQMIYPTASEDATEEVLHWEPVDDMEFDDEFQLKGSSILKDAIGRRAARDKLKLKPARSPGSCDDSDSDMDDFRSVLEDSEMCLKVVDHSLKKNRHDSMGTGLARPGKYAEMLATCETNISCVKNVCQHLTSEDIGVNDVQRVQDLLRKWEDLCVLAATRVEQSQQLSGVSDSMHKIKKAVEGVKELLTYDCFNSKEELETTITQLRVKQQRLEKQQSAIREQQQTLEAFQKQHPSINISKFLEELNSVECSTVQAKDKLSSHLANLENNWAVWCEYLEEQKELDALVAADRDRLFAMLRQHESGQQVTKKDVLRELETLQNNLSMYETKLAVLQEMRNRLTQCSSDDVQRMFLASIADLRNQLLTVSERCRQMYKNTEDDEAVPVDDSHFGRLAMPAAAVHESLRNEHTLEQLNKYDKATARTTETPHSGLYSGSSTSQLACNRTWSWLRSVPVQIVALMMVAGLVYVLDPDILSGLANFSVTISPELRHVNGPPPL